MSPDRIVSSAHLASEEGGELSEFEFGLIMAFHAFSRWTVRCQAAAGAGALVSELGPVDILALHSVNHRDRAKRLADICFTLNIEDTHIVNYALKKLLKAELVVSSRKGKEVFYETSEAGQVACERYRDVRETCLIDAMKALGGLKPGDISATARTLRALSGLYDQAARSATSL